MMNSLIFGGIGFVLGGILGGYFVGSACVRDAEKTIGRLEFENEHLKEELEATKEYAFAKREEKIAKDEAEVHEYKAEDFGNPFDPAMGDPFSDFDEDPEDDEDEDEPDISIIEAEQFKLESTFRENETITYYQEDGVLADSQDRRIRNQEKIIGRECAEMIDDTDKDFIYVSNDVENKLYEIIVDHNQGFYRDVVGAEA